ncbi:MAG: VOC family protein [Myxococcaceae bacterium]
MTTINKHTFGTPAWVDLMTPDLEKARAFYGELFGWTFDVGSPETGFYTMCRLGGRNAAGMGKMPPDAPFPTSWSVYFAVESTDATCARIKEHGGQIMMEPMDVMGEGRMAFCADSTGAAFGLWQPMRHTGANVIEEPGAMVWQEVNTRDAARAVKFYSGVFGLEGRKLEDPTMQYFTLHKGPKAVCGVLQMDEKWPKEIPPHWMNYFAVSNTDEAVKKVTKLGGKVVEAPFDTPYGRMAVVTDPFGAHFNLVVPSDEAMSV